MAASTKRQCCGTTKKGELCKAAPLRDSDFCLAHSDAKTRESVGFVADNGKAGRPKKPRVVDVLRERIEEEADHWFDLLKDASVAMKVVGVVGEGEMAEPIEVEDHNIRLKALSIALDRGYGRPRQEITGADGAPLQLEVTGAAILNDADARKHAAGLRQRVGASRSQQSGRSRASH